MVNKDNNLGMHDRILQGALEVFSEKGYSAATIKDISTMVGCNPVTIFRHFTDKETLFLAVVETYYKIDIDEEDILSRLSYTNIHADLTLISNQFFRILFKNINILRIFINDGPYFEQIVDRIWYMPAPFKAFVVDYIDTMYPNVISPLDASLISEMFVSYITRTCLRASVHDGVKELSREMTAEAKTTMALSVNMIVSTIKLHVSAKT